MMELLLQKTPQCQEKKRTLGTPITGPTRFDPNQNPHLHRFSFPQLNPNQNSQLSPKAIPRAAKILLILNPKPTSRPPATACFPIDFYHPPPNRLPPPASRPPVDEGELLPYFQKKVSSIWSPKKFEMPSTPYPATSTVVTEEGTVHSKNKFEVLSNLEEKHEYVSVSKLLGRILSLPGYNSSSPRFSLGRDEVDSPCLMRSSSLHKIKQNDTTSNFSPSQSIKSSSYSDNNLDSGPHAVNSSQSLPELQLHTEEDVIQKGSSKTEEWESLDIPVEFSTDKLVCSSERCYEDSGPCEEALPSTPAISASPNSSLTQKLEVLEGTAEYLDRPSPVSVLEPFFEDMNSPERSKIVHGLYEGGRLEGDENKEVSAFEYSAC